MTGGLAQALTASVRSEEYPPSACEYWPEGIECLLTEHAARATMVLEYCRRWPAPELALRDSTLLSDRTTLDAAGDAVSVKLHVPPSGLGASGLPGVFVRMDDRVLCSTLVRRAVPGLT